MQRMRLETMPQTTIKYGACLRLWASSYSGMLDAACPSRPKCQLLALYLMTRSMSNAILATYKTTSLQLYQHFADK